MPPSPCHRVNAPAVIHEMIEGEAVIVHLDRGHYFSVLGVGAEIWARTVRGETVEQVVDALLGLYEGQRDGVQAAVFEFLGQLLQEDLLVPEPAGSSTPEQPPPAPALPEPRPPFEPPTLQKFTDMEELLRLDPIHETDELGWPHAGALRRGDG